LENYSLTDDGFTFLPMIFQEEEIASARDGLWKTINGIYETNKKPETRFWEVGDDKNKIIDVVYNNNTHIPVKPIDYDKKIHKYN